MVRDPFAEFESTVLAWIAAVIVNNHTNEAIYELYSLYYSVLASYDTLLLLDGLKVTRATQYYSNRCVDSWSESNRLWYNYAKLVNSSKRDVRMDCTDERKLEKSNRWFLTAQQVRQSITSATRVIHKLQSDSLMQSNHKWANARYTWYCESKKQQIAQGKEFRVSRKTMVCKENLFSVKFSESWDLKVVQESLL